MLQPAISHTACPAPSSRACRHCGGVLTDCRPHATHAGAAAAGLSCLMLTPEGCAPRRSIERLRIVLSPIYIGPSRQPCGRRLLARSCRALPASSPAPIASRAHKPHAMSAALSAKPALGGARLPSAAARGAAASRRLSVVVRADSCLIVNTKGGGHAFLGLHLARKLLGQGHEVTILNDGDQASGCCRSPAAARAGGRLCRLARALGLAAPLVKRTRSPRLMRRRVPRTLRRASWRRRSPLPRTPRSRRWARRWCGAARPTPRARCAAAPTTLW